VVVVVDAGALTLASKLLNLTPPALDEVVVVVVGDELELVV
jgi:hypothetical protein